MVLYPVQDVFMNSKSSSRSELPENSHTGVGSLSVKRTVAKKALGVMIKAERPTRYGFSVRREIYVEESSVAENEVTKQRLRMSLLQATPERLFDA